LLSSNQVVGRQDATRIVQVGLFTQELCLPFDVLHENIEKALGRPVWTHEFGMNFDGICREFLRRAAGTDAGGYHQSNPSREAHRAGATREGLTMTRRHFHLSIAPPPRTPVISAGAPALLQAARGGGVSAAVLLPRRQEQFSCQEQHNKYDDRPYAGSGHTQPSSKPSVSSRTATAVWESDHAATPQAAHFR
jgi:hypothetical protein